MSTAGSRVGRSRISRLRLAAVVAALSIVPSLMVAFSAAEPADAAPNPDSFDPGNIISDANFYDGNAMTEAQIQAFLSARGSGLASYRSTVASRPAAISDTARPGYVYCDPFEGGTNLLASTIIYRVQKACGISAKVILVTLQKEQGLILSSTVNPTAARIAMGYACPDTAPCNEMYYGFGNQVYMASWQFKAYQLPENGFYHRPGRISVRFHPNASCGGSFVRIQNWATAGLYNYTPYQPNRAALISFPGLGDSCSSYGNRNFWFFYHAWFGSPVAVYPENVTVTRIEGGSRFETAVATSQATWESADVVYVANGRDFPDALSAAPAAAFADGPLLLVESDHVYPSTLDEITRLAPERIVVVGGEGVVSPNVFDQLSALAPTIQRDAGTNRYATSRAVVESAFGATGSTVAFVATGSNFPDALAASAAAGALNAPVILVPGEASSVDEPTRQLIESLGVETVYIAGGTAVVSSQLQDALATIPGVTSVERYDGGSRYAVSSAINKANYASADTAYFASGLDFPDALAGAAAAGATGQPLYLTLPHCFYTFMLDDIIDLEVSTVTLLGGTGVLHDRLSMFPNCS